MSKERGIDYDAIVTDYRLDRIVEDIQAIKHARNCGCFQCEKYADRLEHDIAWECYEEMNPPNLDHEEEYLFYLALSKLDHE